MQLFPLLSQSPPAHQPLLMPSSKPATPIPTAGEPLGPLPRRFLFPSPCCSSAPFAFPLLTLTSHLTPLLRLPPPGPGLCHRLPSGLPGPGPLSHGGPSSGPRSPELAPSLLPAHTSPAGLRLALTYQPPLSKRCLPLPRAGSPLARSPALTHPPAAPLASFFSSP